MPGINVTGYPDFENPDGAFGLPAGLPEPPLSQGGGGTPVESTVDAAALPITPTSYESTVGSAVGSVVAIADGTSHPLSELYATLTAAQTDFPFVTALGQQRDYAAMQRALNEGQGARVLMTQGIWLIDTPLEYGASATSHRDYKGGVLTGVGNGTDGTVLRGITDEMPAVIRLFAQDAVYSSFRVEGGADGNNRRSVKGIHVHNCANSRFSDIISTWNKEDGWFFDHQPLSTFYGGTAGLWTSVNPNGYGFNDHMVIDLCHAYDNGVRETQRLRNGGATGGTFTLTWNGQTTGALAYNASDAQVNTALRALSNINHLVAESNALYAELYNIDTVGGTLPNPLDIRFTARLIGPQNMVTINDSTTGGTGMTIERAAIGRIGHGFHMPTGNADNGASTFIHPRATTNCGDAISIRGQGIRVIGGDMEVNYRWGVSVIGTAITPASDCYIEFPWLEGQHAGGVFFQNAVRCVHIGAQGFQGTVEGLTGGTRPNTEMRFEDGGLTVSGSRKGAGVKLSGNVGGSGIARIQVFGGGTNEDLWMEAKGTGHVNCLSPFRFPRYTTAARPAPSSVGNGAVIYDTDLQRLLQSTGSAWLTITDGGGGGGAPLDASYVVFTANGTLTAEKTVDGSLLMHGTLANRNLVDATTLPGAYWSLTDNGRGLFRSTSGSWVQIAPGLDEASLWTVAKAGTPVGTRRRINLIEGSNVTITAADDGPNDEVDVTIAAASGGTSNLVTFAKTADTARATETATADPDLKFATLANETWQWEMTIYLSCADIAADIRCGITAATNASGRYGGQGLNIDANLAPYTFKTASDVIPGSFNMGVVVATTMLVLKGRVVNSTLGGDLAFSWARQNTASSDLIVRAGSHGRAWKIS